MSSRVVSNAESVSLITTVYNEARTITDLLESFARQSRLADEILIVDGGSTDGTSELIRAFFKEHDRLNGKLIVKKGANIATGRNTAIVSSQYNIIAVTDGELFEISGIHLSSYLDSHPEIGYITLKDLFNMLTDRLSKANQRVESLFAWGLKVHGIDKHL